MEASIVKSLVYLLVHSLFLGSECARILGVFDLNGKSHFQMSEALMKSLAARGHDVFVVNHFPQKETVPHYTDIDVSGSLPNAVDNITVDFVRQLSLLTMTKFWELSRENCQTTVQHPNVRALVESNQIFDVVITEIFACDCSVGFAHKFKAPLIGIDTTFGYTWTYGRVGNPENPAYIVNNFLTYASKMTFLQRVTNTFFNVLQKSLNYIFGTLPLNTVMKDIYGDDIPTVQEIIKTTSLVLVNSHFSISGPRPTVPNFVEVGGLHIQNPKDLPPHIKKFLDEAVDGVVYFSMGSLLRVQSFPPDKLAALVGAFGKIPEKVLMKYTDDNLPGKPDNVMTGKWLPQQDILRHPNVKLFISHGGQMGTQEAIHAGVPVVGIPVFGDQLLNINRLKEKGVALQVSYDDLTTESLLAAIRNVIDNTSYSENAKRLSMLFRDRPMSAAETAVYWVEYVIRHRGAPHLRSAAADMPLYQYLLLDVIGFLLLAATTSVCIVYYVIKTVLRVIIGSKSVGSRKKTKKQ